jgi:hypothetical protein
MSLPTILGAADGPSLLDLRHPQGKEKPTMTPEQLEDLKAHFSLEMRHTRQLLVELLKPGYEVSLAYLEQINAARGVGAPVAGAVEEAPPPSDPPPSDPPPSGPVDPAVQN